MQRFSIQVSLELVASVFLCHKNQRESETEAIHCVWLTPRQAIMDF